MKVALLLSDTYIGKPPRANSAVCFNIVQKGAFLGGKGGVNACLDGSEPLLPYSNGNLLCTGNGKI